MATQHVTHYYFQSKLGKRERLEFTQWQLLTVTSQACFDPDKGIPIEWAHALIEYWNSDPAFRNRYSLERI